MRISIIIPTLNEEDCIRQALMTTRHDPDAEVIVVDGGSHDRTVQRALAMGARVIHSPAGRGRQLIAGTEQASGDVFLFLHGDSCLPVGFGDHVRRILARQGVVAGAFRLSITGTQPSLRIIERLANWRSHFLQMPFGDQAIFLEGETLRMVRGLSEYPLMEDLHLVRHLRHLGKCLARSEGRHDHLLFDRRVA